MDSPSGPATGPRVIFTGDDFGRTPEINAAIIRAHREGVLTSASLMVAAPAAGEAVALARANPTLGVGLHVVVSAGRTALPQSRVPNLLDAGGRLGGANFRTGVRYAFRPAVRRELSREIAAQFERFAATGLPLSHVDCHQHMHLHPAVLSLVIPLAERAGARGIRLPRDDFRLARDYGRLNPDARGGPGSFTLAGWSILFAGLCRFHARRLRRSRLAVADRVYGLARTGRMEEGYVVEVLRRLRVPSAEIYFHPSTVFEGEALGPNPGDLATLLCPAVRRAIIDRGLRPSTYATLKQTTNNTNVH